MNRPKKVRIGAALAVLVDQRERPANRLAAPHHHIHASRPRSDRISAPSADRTLQTSSAALTPTRDVLPSYRPVRCDLRAEDQAAAGRGVDDAPRHLGTCLEKEIQPAAMHRDENIGLQFLDLGDHLLQVIHRRSSEMEAADDRVGDRSLRLFPRGVSAAFVPYLSRSTSPPESEKPPGSF